MGLVETTAPATEPITLAEAKAHLRVLGTDDDTYITLLAKAARRHVEVVTGRAFITTRFTLTLDEFPCGRKIYLEKAPLKQVVSVKYYNTANEQETLSTDDYLVHLTTTPGSIELKNALYWPIVRYESQAVEIVYDAGYGDAASDIKDIDLLHGLKFLVAHWYSNREPVTALQGVAEVPKTFDNIVLPFKVWMPGNHD